MARSYVFLVHGVGKQPVGRDGVAVWAEPWKAALLEALRRYAPYDGLTPEQIEERHLCFWPVSYDAVFEDRFRRVWGDLAGSLTSVAVPLPPAARAAAEWVQHNESAQDAEAFFWDNALDALLWYGVGLAHAAVKAYVAPQLVRGVRAMARENGGDLSRAHIVAHSLGTSVVHDTLVALTLESDLHGGVLAPSRFQWQSVTMVANTSRLLESAVDVSPGATSEDFEAHRSILQPGRGDSCCRSYLNVRHRIDPITWPHTFDPSWPVGPYRNVVLDRFGDPKKVHDFGHYVQAPGFHLRLFRALLGDSTLGSPAERQAAQAAYEAAHPNSLDQAFQELRDLATSDDLDARQIVEYLVRAYKVLT
jgi:hypothetical protein